MTNSFWPTSIAVAASAIVSVGGLVLYPFWAEDTTVLFHRANYTDLSTPFYYMGYVSLGPQLASELISPLPIFIQATLYSIIAGIIWAYMVYLVFRIGSSTLVPFVTLAYVFAFDSIYLFNLTYSLWPSVIVIGLIALRARIEARSLSRSETIVVIILGLSSPLSIFMAFPIMAVLAANRRDVNAWLCLLVCLASYPILTDHGDQNVPELSESLFERIRVILVNPQIVFHISGDRLPISPPGLVRSGALATAFLFLFLCFLPPFYRRYGVLVPFVLATLLIFLAALTRGGPEKILATRYYLPVIFASTLILSRIVTDVIVWQPPKALRLFAYCVVLFSGLALGLREHPDPFRALGEFREILEFQPGDAPIFFPRAGSFGNNDWTLALGDFSFGREDCVAGSTVSFRFLIYCGPYGLIKAVSN